MWDNYKILFRKSLFSAVALIGMTFAFYGANSVENVQLSASDSCEDLREEVYSLLQGEGFSDDAACRIATAIETICNGGAVYIYVF